MARYKVISEIGRGGMGVVFRALQIELNREVAMKVVLGGKDTDPRYLKRFEREIDALIRLEHPNIVRIYDKGSSDGSPFFTMELVAGQCLHDVLEKKGPMAPHRILRIMTQMVDALDYIHQKGIIHRDVKPRNIMLCEEDHTVLMDFGLILDPAKTALTGHGAMVGTPRYMAPETVTDVLYTPGTDLYAVGLVGYEMATGFPAVPRNPSLERMVASIVRDHPRPIRETRPDFPAELESVLFALMEKKPEKRPATAEVMRLLADLKEGVAVGLPAVEAPPAAAMSGAGTVARRTGQRALSSPGPTGAGAPRSRGIGAAAAMGALLLSGVTGVVIFLTKQPPPVPVTSGAASPVAPVASPGTAEGDESPPLDLAAEVPRFETLGQELENKFEVQGGNTSVALRTFQSLKNAGQMVTLLHDAVGKLDEILGRAFAPEVPDHPDMIHLVRIAGAVLGAVQSFYTYEARSDALKERVKRLFRHLDPGSKAPIRRAVSGILSAQLDLAVQPSLNGHTKIAERYVQAFDLTRDADPAWRRSPAGVHCRTLWIEDAFHRIRRANVGEDVEHLDSVQQARARLHSSVPDLAAALENWKPSDPPVEPLIVAHTRGMALHLLRDAPEKEEVAPRLAFLEKILDTSAARNFSEQDFEVLAREGALLEEKGKALGLSFRLPATVRWTNEIQAIRRRPKKDR